MELKDAIKNRVSTREYSVEKVDEKIIEDLLECARLAPSAGNRQPWYFVILTKDNKTKIAELLLKRYSEEKEIKDNTNPTKEYEPVMSLLNSIRVINEAPVFILVFRKNDKRWKDGDYLSIGCAVEHICLRATDLGLSTLWVRDVIYMKEEISKLINKKNMDLVTGVAVGYGTEYPYERKKKALKDIMEWYDE